MEKRDPFDFWFAVNNTEIRLLPKRHLETFGSTVLNYHLVAETMDAVGQVRVRVGRMVANPPRIVTPEAYAKVVLEGFGDEAGKYLEWLREHEKDLRILQYGYTLKQESFSEHLVSEPIKAVVERVERDVKDRDDPLSAIVVGVDDSWDVCLVKLFWEIVQHSAGANVRQMQQRRLFDNVGGVLRVVRDEIDADFLAASRDGSRIGALGAKLQRLGLFEEYQDRFFSLVKAGRGK
jgi:hypothetical protein